MGGGVFTKFNYRGRVHIRAFTIRQVKSNCERSRGGEGLKKFNIHTYISSVDLHKLQGNAICSTMLTYISYRAMQYAQQC